MASGASTSLTRQLGALFEGGSTAGLSDRQLLERFATARDEAAFAALVTRHGPMVLGVCRQLLGDHQHAEDAFQATFLVLACKAGSLREPDLLGNWLYGVALRTARKARCRLARRRRTEEAGALGHPKAHPAVQAEQVIDHEQAEALHREIDRLPDAFRRAVVLCYFEGLSPDEAAARLRWPSGTLRSRLVRAREKLRRGLARRGVVLSTTAMAGMLSPRSASASVSSLLCDSTTRAAIAFATRHATAGGALAAAALAREVLRSMLIHKLKLTAMALCLLAVVATGAGWLGLSLAMKEDPVKDPAAKSASVAPRGADRPGPAGRAGNPDEGRMTVTGRVLGPDGQPAAGVPVDLIGAPRTPTADGDHERDGFVVLAQGSTDGDGRFRLEAKRAPSSAFAGVRALAGAAGPGTAFGCAVLNPDAEQPTTEIQLQPEQVLRGKLVDINGRPAAGVAVQVDAVYGDSPLQGVPFETPSLGRTDVLSVLPEGLRAWPKAVTTDAQGRFTFNGIGRGLSIWLSVHDPRYAQHRFDLPGEARDAGKDVALALHPSTIIEGRVLAADTGRPIPDAVISTKASFGLFGARFTTRSRADGQGRFRINPSAGDYFRVRAIPPKDQVYLSGETEFEWTKAAVKKEIDITVPRGVLIHGNVTEQGTGRPVPGAGVRYFVMKQPGGMLNGDVTAREDGSFRFAVPPGKGILMVLAPTLDYIPKEISSGALYASVRGGGLRCYAQDIVTYEVRAGEASHELNATLRPGKTVRGRLLGPAGETVQDAIVLTRQQIDPMNLTWQGHNFIHARDGRFELHGFDPEKPAPAYFLDADHEWGAVVELSGKQAGEEPTVRLQPCGRAKARFVGPDGKPVAKLSLIPYVQLLMTPGATQHLFLDRGEPLAADEAWLPNVDPRHYPTGFATDADGRVTLPALIPGAPYRISDWSTANVQEKGIQLRKDFTVKPGETLDLGDILVEKPGE